jgi:hypothetical protein
MKNYILGWRDGIRIAVAALRGKTIMVFDDGTFITY